MTVFEGCVFMFWSRPMVLVSLNLQVLQHFMKTETKALVLHYKWCPPLFLTETTAVLQWAPALCLLPSRLLELCLFSYRSPKKVALFSQNNFYLNYFFLLLTQLLQNQKAFVCNNQKLQNVGEVWWGEVNNIIMQINNQRTVLKLWCLCVLFYVGERSYKGIFSKYLY